MISTENLVKSFDGKKIVLNGISEKIEKKEKVVIIGPSGSGKSTFLRCLNLLEVPTSGTILFDGVDITKAPQKEVNLIRRKLGMVFQSFNLFPHKTLLQNVMLAPMIVQNKTKEEAEDISLKFLDKVGLKLFAHRYPMHLSGGQQQRGAIARALALAPKVMLYDEPTSAIDPARVDEVLEVMRDLDKEGMTQIIVTHEMRFAKDASDYIIYMEQGEFIEISDEDEIFIAPKDERTRQFLKHFM